LFSKFSKYVISEFLKLFYILKASQTQQTFQ